VKSSTGTVEPIGNGKVRILVSATIADENEQLLDSRDFWIVRYQGILKTSKDVLFWDFYGFF
jgi:hypothetical protein